MSSQEETIKPQTTEEGEFVWKARDGREIPISQMEDDHLIKAMHRSSIRKEKEQSKRDEVGKQIVRKQREYKKRDDLFDFFSQMEDKIYQEMQNRHLVWKYFAEMQPDNIRVEDKKEKDEDIAE